MFFVKLKNFSAKRNKTHFLFIELNRVDYRREQNTVVRRPTSRSWWWSPFVIVFRSISPPIRRKSSREAASRRLPTRASTWRWNGNRRSSCDKLSGRSVCNCRSTLCCVRRGDRHRSGRHERTCYPSVSAITSRKNKDFRREHADECTRRSDVCRSANDGRSQLCVTCGTISSCPDEDKDKCNATSSRSRADRHRNAADRIENDSFSTSIRGIAPDSNRRRSPTFDFETDDFRSRWRWNNVADRSSPRRTKWSENSRRSPREGTGVTGRRESTARRVDAAEGFWSTEVSVPAAATCLKRKPQNVVVPFGSNGEAKPFHLASESFLCVESRWETDVRTNVNGRWLST